MRRSSGSVRTILYGGGAENISGATSAAYTLKTDDNGKYIRVRASNTATTGEKFSSAVGPVAALLNSETPTASVTSVAKTTATQAAVDFTLTNTRALSGTWKVYSASSGDTLASGVTAAVTTWPTLRLSHASDIPLAVYYVSVTEAGKAESARLALTVGNIASSATVSTLASVLEALPANTAETPYTIVLAATNINANWGAINSAVFSSGKYVILDVSACSASEGTITGGTEPSGNDFNVIKDDDYVKGVILPDSLESIGSNAFYSCTSLESIDIPDSVTSIGSSAFYGCTGLETVTVRRYVAEGYPQITSLGSSVFGNASALTHIYVPSDGVATYKTADGWSSYADMISAIVE